MIQQQFYYFAINFVWYIMANYLMWLVFGVFLQFYLKMEKQWDESCSDGCHVYSERQNSIDCEV